MKFRQRLFWFLALLVVIYIVGTLALAGDSAQQSTEACAAEGNLSAEACAALSDAGTGLGVTLVLCIGGFFFTIFALLAWRNGVGLATERRHQEQLAAARGANTG